MSALFDLSSGKTESSCSLSDVKWPKQYQARLSEANSSTIWGPQAGLS